MQKAIVTARMRTRATWFFAHTPAESALQKFYVACTRVRQCKHLKFLRLSDGIVDKLTKMTGDTALFDFLANKAKGAPGGPGGAVVAAVRPRGDRGDSASAPVARSGQSAAGNAGEGRRRRRR